MSAGAVVAMLIGIGAAMIADRRGSSASTAATTVADSLDRAATTSSGAGRFYVALAVGLLALVFGVTTFIRSQNSRS